MRNHIPFCFVRINDGETSAILHEGATPSRGDESYNTVMSEKLENILSDNYEDKELFIGIPCINCYGQHYIYVKNMLNKSKSNEFLSSNVMDANILINNNYDKTFNILIESLKDTKNVFVFNENCRDNLKIIENNLFPISKKYTVTPRNAFTNCYDTLKDLEFDNNNVIITLCGPLGRVLCYEWYKKNPNCTYLDLGSFFDPILKNKSYLYHTNNHKYCFNCYPNSKLGYSDIFKYCNKVEKECYYLKNLEEIYRLYGNNINGAINNLNVWIEKESKSTIPYYLLTSVKLNEMLKNISKPKEGFTGQINEQYYDLIRLCRNRNPMNILEIGFLCGSSTLAFLETGATVTSIELKQEQYSDDAYKYLSERYPNKLKLIYGNSINIVPTLTELYDLIFIDGSHYYNDVLCDLNNCCKRATKNTLFIMDDVITQIQSFHTVWTIDPTKVYNDYLNKGLIRSVFNKDYKDGRGMVAFYYTGKENKDSIFCNIVMDIHSKLLEDINLSDKLVIYLKESKLLQEISTLEISKEGYTFQLPELFEDLINIFINTKPCKVLDIGFLQGSSSLPGLYCNAYVTSIDINKNETTDYIINLFNKEYPGKFTFIHGDSKIELPKLSESYDIIIIDGGHDYDTVLSDVNNSIRLLKDSGIIIMNDVVSEDKKLIWNEGATAIFNALKENDIIDIILSKTYSYGRGLSIFRLKKKNYYLNR